MTLNISVLMQKYIHEVYVEIYELTALCLRLLEIQPPRFSFKLTFRTSTSTITRKLYAQKGMIGLNLMHKVD